MQGLTGLWFNGAKYFAANLPEVREEKRTPILDETARWLDIYFAGGQPDFTPPLHLIGSDFRRRVWKRLLEIPYGQTTTYGALLGGGMSAQAVGGAVGHNPISIIVPCHRVIGANGSLTGYAGRHGQKNPPADAGGRRCGAADPIKMQDKMQRRPEKRKNEYEKSARPKSGASLLKNDAILSTKTEKICGTITLPAVSMLFSRHEDGGGGKT